MGIAQLEEQIEAGNLDAVKEILVQRPKISQYRLPRTTFLRYYWPVTTKNRKLPI